MFVDSICCMMNYDEWCSVFNYLDVQGKLQFGKSCKIFYNIYSQWTQRALLIINQRGFLKLHDLYLLSSVDKKCHQLSKYMMEHHHSPLVCARKLHNNLVENRSVILGFSWIGFKQRIPEIGCLKMQLTIENNIVTFLCQINTFWGKQFKFEPITFPFRYKFSGYNYFLTITHIEKQNRDLFLIHIENSYCRFTFKLDLQNLQRPTIHHVKTIVLKNKIHPDAPFVFGIFVFFVVFYCQLQNK